jgi:hypothetical protein
MGRKIEPKLVAFIDKKLEQNGSAQVAIVDKDARAVFTYAMEACVGIREAGSNAGTYVELIQETLGGADHEAWCMSAVQSAIAYAELKTGIKSPVYASEHCMTCWRESPENQRVKFYPARGAIVIWRHGNSDSGHTGVVCETDGETIVTVEGNTGPEAGVQREGDGMYRKHRNIHGSGSMKVMGFLKPF